MSCFREAEEAVFEPLRRSEYGKTSILFKSSTREDYLWWKDVSEQRSFAAHEVTDRIYLGGVEAAMDQERLRVLNISYALTVARDMVDVEPVSHHHNNSNASWFDEHAVIPVYDTEDDLLLMHFQSAIQFIDACLEARPSRAILVHCVAGVSRSATIVIAYMMYKYSMPYGEALSRVQAIRTVVQPNDGFVHQLQLFEEHKCDFDAACKEYKRQCE